MPRISRRARAISNLAFVNGQRIKNRILRFLNDEDDPTADALDLILAKAMNFVETNRYLYRPSKYRRGSAEERYETDLNEDLVSDSESSEKEHPWLNDDEFLQKYRMTRKSFQIILDKIKDDPVFNSKQRPVEYQLLTWLNFAGIEGTGGSNSNQRNTFSVGYGTSDH